MPKYIVEGEIPNGGQLSTQDLQQMSQAAWTLLDGLGTSIQWVRSYVTRDKVYGIYIAPSMELILEMARQGAFQANRVFEVRDVIHPACAKA